MGKNVKWQRRWYTGPPELRRQLWAEYGYDRKKYFQAYQPDEEDFVSFQELGMEAFVKLERRLRRQICMELYVRSGQESLESLGAAIANASSTNHLNITLVSIDFEGTLEHKGVNEFGLARLNSNAVLTASDQMAIETSNFALNAKKDRNRKYLFGQTTKTTPELLPLTIAKSLQGLVPGDEMHEVVLVCHGLSGELRILDDLGLALKDSPFTGVVDTNEVARDILGHSGSLEYLLTNLNIPWRHDSLHCAGNDAHYTLQVMLALIQIRYGDSTGQVNRLARHPVPTPPCWQKEESMEDDWDAFLGSDVCMMFS